MIKYRNGVNRTTKVCAVSGLNRLHADIHLRLLTLELEYV